MDSIRQMRRIAVEVMQLLALTNWAPSEEPQKCCLEDISGVLQFCTPLVGAVQISGPDQPLLGPPPSMALEPHFKLSLLLDLLLLSRTKGGCASRGFGKPQLESLQLCILHLSLDLLLSWEAPRWWMQLLLWIIWPGIMMGFFFLACVAPSSSSVSSDCVVLAVSLPTLAQLERGAGQGHWCWLCVSVCLSVLTRCGVAVPRCVCVCVHMHCSHVCLHLAQTCSPKQQLVLQAWRGNRIPLLDYWIWQILIAIPLGQCALQICWRWTLPPSRPQVEM